MDKTFVVDDVAAAAVPVVVAVVVVWLLVGCLHAFGQIITYMYTYIDIIITFVSTSREFSGER